MRATVATVLLAWASLGPVASSPAQDAALATGLRQVEEGDFEAAVATLEPVVERSGAGGGRIAAQACLQLAIAHLALDHGPQARTFFRKALDHQPGLRLGPERYSPKVIAAFEEARQERDAALRSSGKHGFGARGLLLAGAGAAAGVGLAILAGSRGSNPGGVRFNGARFSPPAIDCENGAAGVPLAIGIDLEATNDGDQPVRVNSVSTMLIIVSSPLAPGEVGTAESAPATVTPATVDRGTSTLHVRTTLACYNAAGDEPRYNDWLGRATLVTAAGAVTLETSDRLRINIP
jgi:hypothetical protein